MWEVGALSRERISAVPKKCPTGTFLLEKCPSRKFSLLINIVPSVYVLTYHMINSLLMVGDAGVKKKRRRRGDYNFPPSSRPHFPHIYSSMPTLHLMGDTLHHIDAPTLSTRCAPKAHQERERERPTRLFAAKRQDIAIPRHGSGLAGPCRIVVVKVVAGHRGR